MRAAQFCTKAAELVSGDRNDQHGDLKICFANMAAMFSAYLGIKVTPAQAAMLMQLVKVARTKSGMVNPDDYLDAVGYAAIAGELATGEKL